MKSRVKDQRVFVNTEQTQFTQIWPMSWIVNILEVAIRAKWQQVSRVIVGRVIIKVVQLWIVATTHGTLVPVLLQNKISNLPWN